MTLKLVLRNLLAHPFRTFLTTGSVLFAVMLLSILTAAISSLTASIDAASTKRLWVQSAVSLFVGMPIAYESKIAAVEGVDYVSKWQWFGGVYKDDSSFFAQFAVDPETFLKSYPELSIVAGSYEKFAKNRASCILGQDIADKFGFSVGDTIPIIGRIYPRKDGMPWEFKIEAIYRTSVPVVDQNTLYFHFDYLEEARKAGVYDGEPEVGVFMVRPEEGADPVKVSAAVDLLFKDGPQRTETTTEAEFGRQFVTMMGNIPLLLQSICGGVLFAIFFAVLNTMMMAGQERTRDTGVMKALGFPDARIFRILMSESLLISVVGGLGGVGFAKLMESGVQSAFANLIPGFVITTDTLVLGIGIALGIGLFAGLAPAMRARRLTPIAALREEG